MASSFSFAFAAIALVLIFQSVKADDLGDLLAPILSPIFQNVCKEVECGKGSCKPSDNSTFSFECECNDGWKKTLSDGDDDEDDHFKFLPCIIPNCTLNHSCLNAPPPGQQNRPRTNQSIFDPCYWADCGGGSCNKTSPFTHECVCLAGYFNLLNVTAFPCFKECSIGLDCQKLGIPVTNTSASNTPSSSANDNGNASRLVFERWSVSMISLAAYVSILLLI